MAVTALHAGTMIDHAGCFQRTYDCGWTGCSNGIERICMCKKCFNGRWFSVVRPDPPGDATTVKDITRNGNGTVRNPQHNRPAAIAGVIQYAKRHKWSTEHMMAIRASVASTYYPNPDPACMEEIACIQGVIDVAIASM